MPSVTTARRTAPRDGRPLHDPQGGGAGPDPAAILPGAVLPFLLAAALELGCPGPLSAQPASPASRGAEAGPAAAGSWSPAVVPARGGWAEGPAWLQSGLERSVRLEARVGRPAAALPSDVAPVSGAGTTPTIGDADDASVPAMAGLGAVGGVLGLAAGGGPRRRVSRRTDRRPLAGRKRGVVDRRPRRQRAAGKLDRVDGVVARDQRRDHPSGRRHPGLRDHEGARSARGRSIADRGRGRRAKYVGDGRSAGLARHLRGRPVARSGGAACGARAEGLLASPPRIGSH